MPTDIQLYMSDPDQYNQVQNMRPDYRSAIETTVGLAKKYLQSKPDVSIVDFCGGTGYVTKKLAESTPMAKAVIVDINQRFLDIAQQAQINVGRLETICSDILNVRLRTHAFDAVLSVFAYHHVPDDQKELYLTKALQALKPNGILILTEIYVPDKQSTLAYYQKLISEIPNKNPILEQFLTETAQSKNFEFKVSKAFAEQQMKRLGFKELESVKIWPLDQAFAEDIGTFVQVLQRP
ncbi:MAG: methyltransferase domain-containing protein [Parcubacteria group bacterium]|nr:methyltransferase domain-containing protein [Parcubacteria group bacterium]